MGPTFASVSIAGASYGFALLWVVIFNAVFGPESSTLQPEWESVKRGELLLPFHIGCIFDRYLFHRLLPNRKSL